MVQLACIALVIIVYFVTVFVSIKITVDKLGAYSAHFGAGIVNVVFGALFFAISGVDEMLADLWSSTPDDPLLLYYMVRFGMLALALIGVVQVCVDLLQRINQMERHQMAANAKDSGNSLQQSQGQPVGNVPAWKRVQMEETDVK